MVRNGPNGRNRRNRQNDRNANNALRRHSGCCYSAQALRLSGETRVKGGAGCPSTCRKGVAEPISAPSLSKYPPCQNDSGTGQNGRKAHKRGLGWAPTWRNGAGMNRSASGISLSGWSTTQNGYNRSKRSRSGSPFPRLATEPAQSVDGSPVPASWGTFCPLGWRFCHLRSSISHFW